MQALAMCLGTLFFLTVFRDSIRECRTKANAYKDLSLVQKALTIYRIWASEQHAVGSQDWNDSILTRLDAVQDEGILSWYMDALDNLAGGRPSVGSPADYQKEYTNNAGVSAAG